MSWSNVAELLLDVTGILKPFKRAFWVLLFISCMCVVLNGMPRTRPPAFEETIHAADGVEFPEPPPVIVPSGPLAPPVVTNPARTVSGWAAP